MSAVIHYLHDDRQQAAQQCAPRRRSSDVPAAFAEIPKVLGPFWLGWVLIWPALLGVGCWFAGWDIKFVHFVHWIGAL